MAAPPPTTRHRLCADAVSGQRYVASNGGVGDPVCSRAPRNPTSSCTENTKYTSSRTSLPLQLFRDPAQHRAADAVIKRTPGYASPTQAGQTAFQRAEIADLHLALRLTFVFGADIHVHLFRFQVSGSRASLGTSTPGTVSEHNSGVRRRNAVDAANRRNADKSVVVYQRDQKSDLVHMRAKHDAPALTLRGTSLPVGNERAHRIVVHAVTQRRHGHHQLVRNRLFIAGDTPHGGRVFIRFSMIYLSLSLVF